MRALILTSVASMIGQFNIDNIRVLQEKGYEVEVATNFLSPGTITIEKAAKLKKGLEENNVVCNQIDFLRGVGTIRSNLKVMKQLNILKNERDYTLVHCQSPIGGALGRFVFKNSNARILYTAHGFQFFKGGPRKDWVLFYPVEKFLSRYTDLLLTINNDDTKIANSFHAKKVLQIPGVGFDWRKYQRSFTEDEKEKIRGKYGLPLNKKIMVSVGEVNGNKNHFTGIKAMEKFGKDLLYVICGQGNLLYELEKYISKNGLEDKVKFLGYVDKLEEIFAIADFSLFISKREGLGLSGLEAMASGLPIISSNVGGIKDYTKDNYSGKVIENPKDVTEVRQAIQDVLSYTVEKFDKISKYNKEKSHEYSLEKAEKFINQYYFEE